MFGDGLVYALPVPGHAPGMVALLVRSGAAGPGGRGWTLLAGDVAYHVRALREGGEPHPLARAAFWNVRDERESRARVHTWLAAHPHARVIVSHDVPEPPGDARA